MDGFAIGPSVNPCTKGIFSIYYLKILRNLDME